MNHAQAISLKGHPFAVVPYNTPGAEPRPLFRCQAWALEVCHNHGARFVVTSGIRVQHIVDEFNKTYGTNLHGQQYLYDHQNDPGFFPANPPWVGSHCGFADGSKYYPNRGSKLKKIKFGIDLIDDGTANEASSTVRHGNEAGISMALAYPGSAAEAHHVVILSSATRCWWQLYRQARSHHSKQWAHDTRDRRGF